MILFILHCVKTRALTVVGSSSGSSMSACRRNTLPRQTLHSILSKVGILSLPITPATKLQAVSKVEVNVYISITLQGNASNIRITKASTVLTFNLTAEIMNLIY